MFSALVAEYTTPVQINDKWESSGDSYTAFLDKGVLFIISNKPSGGQTLKYTFVLSGGAVTLHSGFITVRCRKIHSDKCSWKAVKRLHTLWDKPVNGVNLSFEKNSTMQIWFDKLRGLSRRNYADVIEEIGKRGGLGEGACAGVTRGKLSSSGQEVAVKRLKVLWNASEIFACVGLKHPNIVPAVDVLFDGRDLCIVMPIVNGGELYNHIIKTDKTSGRPVRVRFEEKKAQKISEQILKAIVYMHQLGIAHRDLHYGNILCDVQNDGLIKPMIVDFGFCFLDAGPKDMRRDLAEICEVVFRMLTGKILPHRFHGKREEKIATEIGRYASNEASEFVIACLRCTGTPRDTEKLLKHIWLAQSSA